VTSPCSSSPWKRISCAWPRPSIAEPRTIIRKPVNLIELQARMHSALRAQRLMELLREQARIDALTGLLNRAGMDEALSEATALHERLGSPLALFLFDVDRFKRINDERGHGAGDEVRRAIGSTLRKTCRPYDTPCR
jgi:two-component system cell cycle response regulator